MGTQAQPPLFHAALSGIGRILQDTGAFPCGPAPGCPGVQVRPGASWSSLAIAAASFLSMSRTMAMVPLAATS